MGTENFRSKTGLVWIPSGEFLMGSCFSDDGKPADEAPVHRVYVDDYCIGRYPVTNEEYLLFVKDTGHRQPCLDFPDAFPYNWRNGTHPLGCGKHPVVLVSWEDAVAYCQWLSEKLGRRYRLPTEAEWEKAARGTGNEFQGHRFPWGEEWDTELLHSLEKVSECRITNYADWKRWHDAHFKTVRCRVNSMPVGRFPPNSSDIFDMAGNVWEWCGDWYDDGYYQRWADCVAVNPTGPDEGVVKVARGGSWLSFEVKFRCSHRCPRAPGSMSYHVGFRVVREGLGEHQSG